MDSGNSSSLQSSSGGDDDFDCRVDSLSAFFHSSPAAAAALPPSRSPLPLSSSYDGHHFFDDSSLPYLDSSAPLLPIGSSATAPWPRHLIPSSSNCITAATAPAASPGAHPVASSLLSSSSVQPQLEQPIGAAAAAAAPRSSKKRSRASRRAPTTVLTTDTSNFRAMVQEFTGIPSPPFAVASTSPFARSRFDLYYPADAPPPHFLLRPLPKKLQAPPSFTANPISSPPPPRPLSTTNTAAATANTKIPTDDSNYRSPSHDLGLGGGQRQPLVSHQSPILNFQSLLQPSQLQAKYTLPAIAASYNAKLHITPSDVDKAHELGGLPPGFIGSEALHSSWTDGGADLARLRPAAIDDYLDSQLRVGYSWKPTYSASGPPSEFTGDKASGSVVATRGEGMVESWIHYSD